MRFFWKIAKWFVVIWLSATILGLSLYIWDIEERVAYTNEKSFIIQSAKMLFHGYILEGSLPSPSEVSDSEYVLWLDRKPGRQLIYKIIDAKSNLFLLSSERLKNMSMFFQINGSTNDATLTKIEADNSIQILDEFHLDEEKPEKDKLEVDNKEE